MDKRKIEKQLRQIAANVPPGIGQEEPNGSLAQAAGAEWGKDGGLATMAGAEWGKDGDLATMAGAEWGKEAYGRRKEETIGALLKLEIPERKIGGKWEFVLSQFLMVRKRTWISHVLWLTVFFGMMGRGYLKEVDESAYMLAAVAAPLLVVLSVEEISRIYYRSMLEIECATKYSLRKVVILRLCLMGGLDMLILFSGMLGFRWYADLPLLRVIVYGFTPFLLMCLICMGLMEYVGGEQLGMASAAAAALLILAAFIGGMEPFGIYGSQWLAAWCGVLAAVVGALVYELGRMGKRLSVFEML